MPKLDIDKLPLDQSTNYPPPFNKTVQGRSRKRLGRAAGLTQFGVNLCTLKPGAASSQRHWHEKEDELVYVLEGEVVLCEEWRRDCAEGRRGGGLEGRPTERPLPGEPQRPRRHIH